VAVGSGGPTANEPHIEYHPRPDATPEAELRVLALVYKYVLECAEHKKAYEAGGKVESEVDRTGGLSKEPPDNEGSSA
jgi:hypothetical protein